MYVRTLALTLDAESQDSFCQKLEERTVKVWGGSESLPILLINSPALLTIVVGRSRRGGGEITTIDTTHSCLPWKRGSLLSRSQSFSLSLSLSPPFFRGRNCDISCPTRQVKQNSFEKDLPLAGNEIGKHGTRDI